MIASSIAGAKTFAPVRFTTVAFAPKWSACAWVVTIAATVPPSSWIAFTAFFPLVSFRPVSIRMNRSPVCPDDPYVDCSGNVSQPAPSGTRPSLTSLDVCRKSAYSGRLAHYTGPGVSRGSKGESVPRHIVEVSQFSRDDLEFVFDRADEMRTLPKPDHRLDGRILATLFYEPSTRTRLSFESAMLRLGGNVISTENAREFSSAIKGESVEDTIRIVEGYADAIVIRHFEQGAAARAASVSSVPVLNAGDGPGEHPTQALLDLYTIRHALGRIDNLRVALVGDLTVWASGSLAGHAAHPLRWHRAGVRFATGSPDGRGCPQWH